MTRVADKYISESGRTASYGRAEFTDDMITAGLFPCWAEEQSACFGGIEAKDAMRAMCRMLDVNPRGLRAAIMGPVE
jgi:hypothetical protein